MELARFTRWNLRWEIVPNLIVAGLTFLLLVFLLRRTVRPYGRGIHLLAGVAFAWLFFSPIQWENWLLGWQVAWFLVSLAGVAAAAVLSEWPEARPVWPGVALGVVAGVVASYSLASGLLIWLACGAVFLARRRLRPWLAAWLLAGAVTGAVYVIGYHKPAQTPPLSAFLRDPLHSALFLLAYLGTPLWGRERLAVVVGLGVLIAFAGAVAYLALREREALRKAIVWVALAAYALLGALMTDVARVGFGVAQATASRYTTSALLFFLSTLALAAIVVATRQARRDRPLAGARALLAAVVVVVVVAGVARSYTAGVRGMDAEHALLERGRTCMASATATQHACLEELVHDNEFAWRLLQYLRQEGLAGLSEAPPDRAARRGRADGSSGPIRAQGPG